MEGLTIVGEEHGIIQDMKRSLEKDMVEDEMAGAVWKLRESGEKSLISSEWAETNRLLTFRGKVYVLDVHDLRW